MSAFDVLRYRLRVLFRRKAWEQELDEELRFHQDLEAMQQAHAGLGDDEARVTARRRLGSSAYYREEARHMTGFGFLVSMGQDLRFVIRSLRREPLFAGFVVVTLGLGIGANAAMFGVVDRLLLRGPEHVRDPERVVRLYVSGHSASGREYTHGVFGSVSYEALRNGTHAFEELAVYTVYGGNLTLGRGIEAQELEADYVAPSFFPLLGVQPILGRFFDAQEDATAGAQRVAVISYGLWRRVFGQRPDVLGRTVAIEDEPYTVVGVAPRGFTGTDLGRVDLWLPMGVLGPRVTTGLGLIGRLKPGVTREQAEGDATAAHRRAYGNDPSGPFSPDARLWVAPLGTTDWGAERWEARISRWLVGVTLAVLLLACANVINLLLARAVRRRREVTVRVALGVGKWRLVRLLIAESVSLAVAGSVAGLAIAYVLATLVRILLPDIEWTQSPVDGRVLAVATIMALTIGIVIGLIPAVRAAKADVATGLKAGVREGGGRRSGLRSGLMVAQAALSVVLLVGAGLFVRSLWNVRMLDLGLEPDRVLTVAIRWPSMGRIVGEDARERERARRAGFYRQALERVRRLPAVEHASLTIGLPFVSSYDLRVRIPGRDSVPSLPSGGPKISAVTAEYFATMGTSLLRGRAFTPQDRAGSERVAMVSDLMARTVWPGSTPLGECLLIEDLPCARIVGVVADVPRYRLSDGPHMHYYVPLGQETGMGATTLLVRPTGDPERFAGTVRRVLLDIDPALVYVEAESLRQIIDPQVRPFRLGAAVFGWSALLALVVAAVGLYSVLSYLVEQRTQEIGVRVALGARVGNIVRLVLRESLGMTLVGIILGAGIALIGGRFLQSLLFEASPRDPTIFATVAASLMLVAVIASALPAWRANRVDPIEALRAE